MQRLLRSSIRVASIVMAALMLAALPARAASPLLDETVDFTGTFIFLEAKVPGLVIAVVRNGESVVHGYGETAKGNGKVPDGDTLMRIGSITKVFAGATLASMVADGKVGFTDRLTDKLGWNVAIPELDHKPITLIDLATYTSGLPREPAVKSIGKGTITAMGTKDDYIASLKPDVQMFPAGTGMAYSNFGYDLLAQALGNAASEPYEEVLRKRVLAPAGLKDTIFNLRSGDRDRAMQGHGFDGAPLPFIETAPMIQGAGGLYSSANDMVRWLRWHLDRFATVDAEMRLMDHAAYVERDGLNPVVGFDEAGRMDAMGLGWVVMRPEGDRPLILQKTGGLQGEFSYVAFAPARGIGVFASINEFSVGGFDAMSKGVNKLITELAPR
ncbi:MAG: D-alanyl-D-alanine-carboxypeptidase/endopeptidase AmpH [Xanthobacteraceae bacterium]|nr:D-alanyl-D-alanine-carboxypeptidase/endopeptidase AmpH [Xanthobacteraceae bacterium]